MKVALMTVEGATFISAKSSEYKKDGRSFCGYKINVESQNGDIAELTATQDAYDAANSIQKYSTVVVYGEYDTNYRNFRITHIDAV